MGPGRRGRSPFRFPGLHFPQQEIHTREGSPKIYFQCKIVRRTHFWYQNRVQTIHIKARKKSQSFTLKPKLKILVDVYKRERNFMIFRKKNLTKFLQSKNLHTHQKSASETTQNFHNVDFPKNCLPVSRFLLFAPPPPKYEKEREKSTLGVSFQFLSFYLFFHFLLRF